jgi:hypothetical protein
MANTYELIQATTLTSSQASIDFNSIPGTYTDLILITSARDVSGSGDDFIYAQFNASATGYSGILIRGNGSTAASGGLGTTYAYVGQIEGTARTASTFTNSTCYISNYAGSTQKAYSVDTVSENNATAAYAAMIAGLWSGTAAITSISLTSASAANFAQYTTAYLYGVKNA